MCSGLYSHIALYLWTGEHALDWVLQQAVSTCIHAMYKHIEILCLDGSHDLQREGQIAKREIRELHVPKELVGVVCWPLSLTGETMGKCTVC